MLSASRTLRAVCLIALVFLLVVPFAALAEGTNAIEGAVVLPEPTPESDVFWRLTDDDPNSRVTLEKGDSITVEWSEPAAALMLEWYRPPVSAQIDLCGETGAAIETVTVSDGRYVSLIPLPEGAQRAVFTASETELSPTPMPAGAGRLKNKNNKKKTTFALSEYRLLDAEEAAACQAPTLPEKVDLMLVAAHTGDEACYFGTLLPAYAAEQQMQTVTVFLSHQNRLAQRQAMEAQQLSGVTNQPVFLGMYYRYLEQEYAEFAKDQWPAEDVLPGLVESIRRYRPEVVVTHSADGEQQDGMHKWTASLTEQAVALAADETQYPDSAVLYGAWQVKKLYLHSETGSTAVAADVPLNACAGRTAGELATEAFSRYTQYALYHPAAETSPRFTLAQSQVGQDSSDDSLFENIPADALTNVNAVLPTPSPAPTPEPTAVPTAAPAPTEAPVADLPVQGTAAGTDAWFVKSLVAMGLGLAASAVLGVLLLLRRKPAAGDGAGKPRRAAFRILLCLVPLLAGSAVAILLTPLAAKRLDPAYAASVSAAAAVSESPKPTPAEPTAEPALAPSPSPEAEPTASLSGDPALGLVGSSYDEFFLAADDPAGETVSVDTDGGHWSYASPTLSIRVERHESTSPLLVWYVAHIRMREIDAFRPAYGYYDERGSAKEAPWLLARRYRAVLAITGDNLANDELGKKGILIRKGRIYGEALAQDTMALTADLSMKIYTRKAVNAIDILEDGVENTFGFGPTLLQDGEVGAKIALHRVKGINPRCGLGMVEPGHFVAIVVDGRQKDYSVGIDAKGFAQMFLDEGCTAAYNMDGGISAGMVFMGENLNLHRSARLKHTSSQRPWPDALTWGYSDLVPLMTDPIYNTGNRDETELLNATPSPAPTAEPTDTPAPELTASPAATAPGGK